MASRVRRKLNDQTALACLWGIVVDGYPLQLIPLKRTDFEIVLAKNQLSYCIWRADKPACRSCLLIVKGFVRRFTVDGCRFNLVGADGDNCSRADVRMSVQSHLVPLHQKSRPM